MSNVDNVSHTGRASAATYANQSATRGHRNGSQVYRRFGKRALDLSLVIISLPAVLLVLMVLAVLVMRDGAAPFYGHERVGRGGRSFKCWKIRTMVPDSAQRLKAHLEANPEAKAEWEANFKLDNDPRITRVGRVLRRTSLDELPQLWNILRGEMSIVGPRPVTAVEMERYGRFATSYYAMSPGLTGLWQVSGRNDLDYHERVALDVEYTQSVTLLKDLFIIARTFIAVLNRTGR